MQPLKRFTQCGSLTMLFGVFIILFGVSSTALTTFGKTNNQPPPTQTPTVKGRECSTHEDCSAIERTSCVRDPNDYKLRCLCGDDSPPANGLCPDVLKGLRHKCNNNNDCEDGMVCQFENNNNRTIGVSKFMSSKIKQCLCDNDNGYVEDILHDICNGANDSYLVNILVYVCSLMTPFAFSAFMAIKKEFLESDLSPGMRYTIQPFIFMSFSDPSNVPQNKQIKWNRLVQTLKKHMYAPDNTLSNPET